MIGASVGLAVFWLVVPHPDVHRLRVAMAVQCACTIIAVAGLRVERGRAS